MGVWIETTSSILQRYSCAVTPFVGVWIETAIEQLNVDPNHVTPFVGVWIETSRQTKIRYLFS